MVLELPSAKSDSSGLLCSRIGGGGWLRPRRLGMKDMLGTLVRSSVLACASLAFVAAQADACTRVVYATGYDSYIVARSMDWAEDPGTDLWSFPRGLERDGGVGEGSITWTSKYGSVIASFYNVATVEGMNVSLMRTRRKSLGIMNSGQVVLCTSSP